MKKSLLLSFVVVLSLCFSAFHSFAQGYVSYKVNGVQYKATEDQFTSYSSSRTDGDDKKLCKYFSLSVSGIYNIAYTVEIDLNIDLKKAFELGQYKLAEEMAFYKVLPTGNLGLVRRLGEDKYEFYRSENGSKGNITITKIDGEYIEGTFEGDAVPQYPLTSKVPLKITEGKFRCSIAWMD